MQKSLAHGEKMIKIAVSGKARSGKNTVSKLIIKEFNLSKKDVAQIAFADPIKQIIKTMFPQTPNKQLFGPSGLRSSQIQNILKDNKPLTIRQVLLDVGDLSRSYDENVWINKFDHSFNNLKNKQLIIVPDLRFRNEFDYLKSKGFYTIRIIRDDTSSINHLSETGQSLIRDDEFNSVIYNTKQLKHLKSEVSSLIPLIRDYQ